MDVNLQGRSLALIGGAGFIGHHLALELARTGADVCVIDSFENGVPGVFASVPGPFREFYAALLREREHVLQNAHVRVRALSARDSKQLEDCLQQVRPDAIVHLAGIAATAVANNVPRAAFGHGLETLVNCLEHARSGGTHVLYVSSSMVYGDFKGEAAREEDGCEPIGLYGTLKKCGEQITLAYGDTFDVPYTIVRPCAVYGERAVARTIGQVFIENAMSGQPLTVKGDGNEAMDFTYVWDLVNGLVRCLHQPAARNNIFNLTFGESRTLNQLVEIVQEQFTGVKVKYEQRQRLTPKRGTLCIDKARRLLGYAPQFPLERGFARYIAWYRSAAARFIAQQTGSASYAAESQAHNATDQRT